MGKNAIKKTKVKERRFFSIKEEFEKKEGFEKKINPPNLDCRT